MTVRSRSGCPARRAAITPPRLIQPRIAPSYYCIEQSSQLGASGPKSCSNRSEASNQRTRFWAVIKIRGDSQYCQQTHRQDLMQKTIVDVSEVKRKQTNRTGFSYARYSLIPLSRIILAYSFGIPSAVLTTVELKRLFEIIRSLKTKGSGIVYISHRLEEIFEIGDRVTVLRNGKLVGTEPTGAITREQLIRMLVGHKVSEAESYRGPGVLSGVREMVLEVRKLTRKGRHFIGVFF